MDTTLATPPLVSPGSILTFTALVQIVMFLWVTDRIGITMASAILLGVILFGVLVHAVREVLAAAESEQRRFGAARLGRR